MASTRSTTGTSKKPRSASRAASRPATTRHVEPDVDRETEDVEMDPAEAQEIEAEGHYVTAELCGEEVQIIPPTAWRSSWQRMLNQGILDGFAEKVLHPEDYEYYLETDPTIAEFMEFVETAASRSGEGPGKSRGPAPSSRRMRRR
ncbi:hypothetical protein [Streptomyces sp. NPDC085937]|uniref:hypothetical protein n=1 Tax=Streptomyces sp. NPDC085937 TaxID=3365742 RepID=UPI0037D770AB